MKTTSSNALARIGTLSLTLNDEARPGWLMPNGSAEYDRAAYPAFVTKFGATNWFLPGSTAGKFKLADLRNLAFVMAGDKVALGAITGAAEFKLTAGHLPAHTHSTQKLSIANTPSQQGLLTSVLGISLQTISKPPTVADGSGDTGSSGSNTPAAIPITPLSLGVNVFIFAGLPTG